MAITDRKRAELLLSDPITLFDHSITKMHSIPRDELEAIQREAMAIRFKEHYEGVEVLRKLADRQGIKEAKEFNDIVPLMFPHTAFKSYPPSLLTDKRFDLLAKWLDKQTIYDLSKVDMQGCRGLEDFLARLDEQTPLNVITSSGTTGTMSLIPKSKKMTDYGMRLWHMFMFQKFGQEPTEEQMNSTVDIVWPRHAKGTVGVARSVSALVKAFCGGDWSRFHALYEGSIDSDLLLLASRMRMAAAKGELDKLKIDPELLARKTEFEAQLAKMPEDMTRFLQECAKTLAGKKVFMTGTFEQLYKMASEGIQSGIKQVFDPDSAFLTGGGMKGAVLPDNYLEVIYEFLGVKEIKKGYGFSEGGTFHWLCEHGHYHVMPWVIPYQLHPETSQPLPRKGVVTGRGAFYDLLSESHWSGVITGDEITIDWDSPCPCGRTSVRIADTIIRYSEKQGTEDDRITCNATQSFAEEAVDFMKEYKV